MLNNPIPNTTAGEIADINPNQVILVRAEDVKRTTPVKEYQQTQALGYMLGANIVYFLGAYSGSIFYDYLEEKKVGYHFRMKISGKWRKAKLE